MSSIDRLRILGIRSFGPDKNDEATVSFSSPLTLILGQNGCGKTTIIEALKYATCGELPSGTDGGSGFVFDPKLADANDVKGQILLKCRNVKGEVKQVKRVVKVQQKYKKLTFSSVDNTFTNGEGKKAESISGRCVDINDVVCQSLGVSRAILTNVIFCHQEDSLWPLEKGKLIKEKFDAIFGITEYNTCLEHMRRLAKEHEEKKAIHKVDVEYRKKFWAVTQEKRKKLDSYRADSNIKQDIIKDVDNKLKPIKEKLREINRREDDFLEFKLTLANLENRKNIIVESITEIKREIKEEFGGTKRDLLMEIESFQRNFTKTENELAELIEQKKNLETEEVRIQKEIDSQIGIFGHMQRDKQTYDENIRARNDKLKKLTNQLGIRFLPGSQGSDTNTEEVLESIKNEVHALQNELKKMKEDQKEIEKSFQISIDQAREKRATLNQDIKSKEKNIADNLHDLKKVEEEIEEVEMSNEKLCILEKNLNEIDETLKKASSAFNVKECKKTIDETDEKIKKLDEKIKVLEIEEEELRQAELQKTTLNNLKERLNKLQDDFNTLETKNHAIFLQLLATVPESNFVIRIQKRIEILSKDVHSIEELINQKERDLSALNEQKKNLSEQLRQKTIKLSRDEERIEECCGQKSVCEYYEESMKLLRDANDRKGTATSSEHMYSKYLQQLDKEHPMCPVCRREFNDKKETIEVLNDLREKLKGFPAKLRQAEEDIKRYTEEQKKAAGLLPLQESINNLKNEDIPRLRAEVQKVETKMQDIENELEIHRNDIESPKSDKEDATKLLSDVILMDQYASEIHSLESDIRSMESSLPVFKSIKTLSNVRDELKCTKTEVVNLRKALSTDQKALSSFNENRSKLINRQTELISQKFNISGGAHKRKVLTEKLEDLNKLQITIKEELEKSRKQVQPISEELNRFNIKLNQTKAQHENLIESKRNNLNVTEKKFEEIQSLHCEIMKYRRDGLSEKLNEMENCISEKQQEKEDLGRQKNELDKQIEENRLFRNRRELKKHNLDNNLKVINKKEELQVIDNEIIELMGKVVTVDREQLTKEKTDLTDQIHVLERSKATAQGKCSEIEVRIHETEKELEDDDYRNAEENYRKSSVELLITTKAIDDLNLYQKAMDWAMIHFHKERMKMINAIVRELWRTIYRGNDIDWIEIKTDESTGTTGKRSYNYKVVQIKSGIELDMPGRCSAGQKVLACLIIRMALAESFSKNCGILALDEPTTNLDRDNIESLSEALAEIVERRSVQRNFQLIVITHDEEFLRKIMLAEKVDRYLEVKRDNRGRSKVTEIKVMM